MALRSVNSTLWQVDRFQRLSPHAKLMYVYLLTHPRGNVLGCFPFLPLSAVDEVGLSPSEAEAALADLKGCWLVARRKIPMVEHASGVVCLPDYLAANPLRGPKHETAAINALQSVPFAERPFRVLLWAVDYFCRDMHRLQEYIMQRLNTGQDEAFTLPGFPTLPPAYPSACPNNGSKKQEKQGQQINVGDAEKIAGNEIFRRFEMFWGSYPNAMHKSTCWEYWKKLFAGLERWQAAILHQRIMKGLADWCNSPAWDEGKMPSAANFLANWLWERDPNNFPSKSTKNC